VLLYLINIGNTLSSTPDLIPKISQPLPQVVTSITENRSINDFIKIDGKKTYLYILPISEEDRLIGALALFHDASYIELRLEGIWNHNLLRFLTMSILIVVITLLVVRWSVTGPIAQFAEWMREFRVEKGKITQPAISKRGDILAPVISEVTHLAKSLSMARARAEEEARLRIEVESLWTAIRLKEHMRIELNGKNYFSL